MLLGLLDLLVLVLPLLLLRMLLLLVLVLPLLLLRMLLPLVLVLPLLLLRMLLPLVLVLPLLLLCMLLPLVLVLPLLLDVLLLLLVVVPLLLSLPRIGFGLLVLALLLRMVLPLTVLLLRVGRSSDCEKQRQDGCAGDSNHFHRCSIPAGCTSLLLAQASCRCVDRVADGLTGYEKLYPAVLLPSGGVTVSGYRQSVAETSCGY